MAKALGELPKIDEALSRGEVPYSKVRAMTRTAAPANEEKLLYMATQATAAQLERVGRGVESVTGPSQADMERWVRVTPDAGGMVKVEARLLADEASLVMKAIAIARDDSAESSADALVQVAESYVAGQRSEDGAAASVSRSSCVCVKTSSMSVGRRERSRRRFGGPSKSATAGAASPDARAGRSSTRTMFDIGRWAARRHVTISCCFVTFATRSSTRAASASSATGGPGASGGPRGLRSSARRRCARLRS